MGLIVGILAAGFQVSILTQPTGDLVQLEQSTHPAASDVLRLQTFDRAALETLLHPYGLQVGTAPDGEPIPGSFWGDEEAGLLGQRLMVRSDTPLHSILHEACHFICMDSQRRENLNTDASGDYDEESAVCYLQILLAGELPGLGRERMFSDMDAWGYSFRLGSARKWFELDADDACQWLRQHGLITPSGFPTYRLRT
jgi:hypothetical protein